MKRTILIGVLALAASGCGADAPQFVGSTIVPTNYAGMTDYEICANALSFASGGSSWDRSTAFQGFVDEARRRQLTIASCGRLVKREVDAMPAATARSPDDKPEFAGSGTGFFVSMAGHVVTNHHVVDECRQIGVDTISNGRYRARLLASNEDADLAVLTIGRTPAKSARLRAGRSVRVGERVVAFGFPLMGTLSSRGVATDGSISALSGLADNSNFLQMSAAVQPGNSGGPLLDEMGSVVGVVVAKLDAVRMVELMGDVPQNVNFAVKRLTLQSFLDANEVDYESGRAKERMTVPDIVDRAKEFTVRIECWK